MGGGLRRGRERGDESDASEAVRRLAARLPGGAPSPRPALPGDAEAGPSGTQPGPPTDPFINLTAEAVAFRKSDGAYMTVPSGIGVLTGMRNPQFFSASGEHLGSVDLDDVQDDGKTVSYFAIRNATNGRVRNVTYLVMWYLAEYSKGAQSQEAQIEVSSVGANLIHLLEQLGMGWSTESLGNMVGNAHTVVKEARSLLQAPEQDRGWILKGRDQATLGSGRLGRAVDSAVRRDESFAGRYRDLLQVAPGLSVGYEALTRIYCEVIRLRHEIRGAVDFVEQVFTTPSVSAAVARLGRATAHMESRSRLRLSSLVADMLQASSLVATETINDQGQSVAGRSMRVLSVNVLVDVLASIAADLERTRNDPFGSSTLVDLDYGPAEPLAVRLARLSLLNHPPSDWARLARDGMLQSMLGSPRPGEMLLAAVAASEPARPSASGSPAGAMPQPAPQVVRDLLGIPPNRPVNDGDVVILEMLAAVAGATALTVTRRDLEQLAERIHLRHQDRMGQLAVRIFGSSGTDLARLREVGGLAVKLYGAGAVPTVPELENVRRLFDALRHEYGAAGDVELNQTVVEVLSVDAASVTAANRRSLLDLVARAKAAGVKRVRVKDLRAARVSLAALPADPATRPLTPEAEPSGGGAVLSERAIAARDSLTASGPYEGWTPDAIEVVRGQRNGRFWYGPASWSQCSCTRRQVR